MPAITPAREAANRQSILTAAEELYDEKPFSDITLGDIAARTSLSRPSVYNYFSSKEEIFLALLTQEQQLWAEDLRNINPKKANTIKKVANAFAKTLEKRDLMLKILALNVYDMQNDMSIEVLADFEKQHWDASVAAFEVVRACLPDIPAKKADDFVRLLFPFIFGLYPYSHYTESQLEAMKIAELPIEPTSVRKLASW